VVLLTLLAFQPPAWVWASRTLRQGDQDPGLGQDPGHTAVVDPGQPPRRTAAADPGQHLRRTVVVDRGQPRGPRVVGQDLRRMVERRQGRRRMAMDLGQDPRRMPGEQRQDPRPTAVNPAQDRRHTAADPRQHRGNRVTARAGSRRGRTPPDHQPPNYAATSMGQVDSIVCRVDPIRCRVDPMLASTETSADREPLPPTSAGTSADRVGLMPVSTEASTGVAQRLETSERTSAVTARRPWGHGQAPVETSAFTLVDRVGRSRTRVGVSGVPGVDRPVTSAAISVIQAHHGATPAGTWRSAARVTIWVRRRGTAVRRHGA
jgi:hypothetical protein